MEALPAAPKPYCICDGPGGKHCTKCKSRHYCSKKCQLVDWHEGGHKTRCKQLAADFQDRLLDELMPLKIKEAPPIVEDAAPAAGSTAAALAPAAGTAEVDAPMLLKLENKEEPPIVEDVAPAAGLKAAPHLSAVRTGSTADAKASALNGIMPSLRGTCGICLDLLPVDGEKQTLLLLLQKTICMECSNKCNEYDTRCPLCRTPATTSTAEFLRRLQKHVDEGNADAQFHLGNAYQTGGMGLKKSLKRAFQFFERAAAQGHVLAQKSLGHYYDLGKGIKINYKTAALWYRRAAEQELPEAQYNLGLMCNLGKGVAQSYDESARWYRLAAAQGNPAALYNLGACYANGQGVPQDIHEALRFCKRAAAMGHAGAVAAVDELEAWLAEGSGRPNCPSARAERPSRV